MSPGRTTWWKRAGKPAVTAIVALALLASPARAQAPGSAAGQPNRPNIVFILTDDQDADTLAYMPRLQALLADQGTTFENMFVTQPQCCPSNASILRGEYPHNTQIMSNQPPAGGFDKFRDLGGEQSTFATWLQAAGYYTGRVGKYLIGYLESSLYVPPGWNDWQGGAGSYFGSSVNDNGRLVPYGDGPDDYVTDVQFDRAIAFIQRRAAGTQPFFLFLAPHAPHTDGPGSGPAVPAPRHEGQFWDRTAPRPSSFNEADVSDKPPAVRNLPLLDDETVAAIDHEFRTRIESLQAVDEGIERLIGALAAHGALDNTYVFFTSDNGYHLGQHRIVRGKSTPYEEAIRVPLVVRGPGVPAGVVRPEFVLNIDFAPTFAEIGGVTPGHEVDGRSLVPLLRGEPASNWRTDFLVENYFLARGETYLLRTEQYAYIEHSTIGFVELYDLWTDPYELESLYQVADTALLADLSARLAALLGCAGASCRD